MKKIDSHVFSGMQRDLQVDGFKPEFLWEAHNVRLTTREGEPTLLALTSEKGNERKLSLTGTYLGHCVVGDYAVIFTTAFGEENPDYIYRVKKEGNLFISDLLYKGNLKFDTNHPIETLGSIESSLIQKVYWVDGKNQPRVINAVKDLLDKKTVEEVRSIYDDEYFDFVQPLKLKESVSVKKYSEGGLFPAGVIQYAITYYHKYGQESNIAWISPLYYTSFNDRGGSPEDSVTNSFRITISNTDNRFDYLRIYSIMRTSINATPVVKRVVDLPVSGNTLSYTDTGTNGSNVDPTYLLYVGGESIVAETLTQKDNTLFLGNIKIDRPAIKEVEEALKEQRIGVQTSSRKVNLSTNDLYYTTLNVTDDDGNLENASTFKVREYYRIGIQFQYKTGKWSDPIYIEDISIGQDVYTNGVETVDYHPYRTGKTLNLPTIHVEGDFGKVKELGYVKARAVAVFPEITERHIIAQGILNPTVYNIASKITHTPDVQASWFFRPFINEEDLKEGAADNSLHTALFPAAAPIEFRHLYTLSGGAKRGAEVFGVPYKLGNYENADKKESWEYYKSSDDVIYPDAPGIYNTSNYEYPYRVGKNTTDKEGLKFVPPKRWYNIFAVNQNVLTLNSPDVEFDTAIYNLNYENRYDLILTHRNVFTDSYGDIDIQTSSPPIDYESTGFIKKSVTREGGAVHLCSTLTYEDFLVDDKGDGTFGTLRHKKATETNPLLYLVYPWHRSGSLNNDCKRDAEGGTRSAVLDKKKISNILQSSRQEILNSTIYYPLSSLQFFSSDQVTLLKLGTLNYYGNVDTLCSLMGPTGSLFVSGNYYGGSNSESISFNVLNGHPTGEEVYDYFFQLYKDGIFPVPVADEYKKTPIISKSDWYGDNIENIAVNTEPVRMKYKSSPHFVLQLGSDFLSNDYSTGNPTPFLYSGEVTRYPNLNTIFGGNTKDALLQNIWIPISDAVPIVAAGRATMIEGKYGDTWYQRFDTLKTYPFTQEDENMLIEIGSFLCETHVNLDGRYDRNRGLISNLNVTPENFNKINPVYSQHNNFFTYKILEDDFYKIDKFTTQVTWSTIKQNAAEIDNWTRTTLASTLDLDGTYGNVTSLNTFNDNLLCFQDKALNLILFNSRVQVNTSDNVPIEITNSQKVDGKRVIASEIGCHNKWSIAQTQSGIYFIDSISKELYHYGESLSNISNTHAFSSWFQLQDSDKWDANTWKGIKTFHDNRYKDIYIVTDKECLVYSELVGQFISFMSYENTPAIFNLNQDLLSLTGSSNTELWQFFAGDNNYYFGEYKPYSLSFISNAEPVQDKIFTDLEVRADFFGQEEVGDAYLNNKKDPLYDDKILQTKRMFDYIRVWNDYQDTDKVPLTFNNVQVSNLKKKFRTWRITLPRDKDNPLQRIRSLWSKVTLGMSNKETTDSMIFYNLNMNFYV